MAAYSVIDLIKQLFFNHFFSQIEFKSLSKNCFDSKLEICDSVLPKLRFVQNHLEFLYHFLFCFESVLTQF